MTEQVLFELEKKMENSEIAQNLREIAEKIENGDEINLESGSQSVNLRTDRPAEFEIKVEREGDEESLELELEWKKDAENGFKIS